MTDTKWYPLILEDGESVPFLINKKGEIKDLVNNRMNPFYSYGYGYVGIFINGKTYPVHRLVAMTFIKRNLKGLHVHHKDHDTTNNSITNLEVLTPAEHAVKSSDKLLSKEKVRMIASDIEKGDLSPLEISTKYGISRKSVYDIIQRITYSVDTKDFDFSKYPYTRKKHEFMDDLKEKVLRGDNKSDIFKWLITDIGLSRDKAYYFYHEAKKALKRKPKTETDMRPDYSEYFDTIDEMAKSGSSFEEMAEYFKNNTDLDRITYSNLIHRRVAKIKKSISKSDKYNWKEILK